MNFKLQEAIEVLQRTPNTIAVLLSGLSEGWLTCREGEGTWSAIEVVRHLIEAEETNWIPRLKSIIHGDGVFPPFDRFAHLDQPAANTLEQELARFAELRSRSIEALQVLILTVDQLKKTGEHPSFGRVTAAQLLSTWVVHDLTHITQIMRVMAKRYSEDVGPWQAYLGILR